MVMVRSYWLFADYTARRLVLEILVILDKTILHAREREGELHLVTAEDDNPASCRPSDFLCKS